ncbi:MAG: ATP-binding protein [Kiritimatiellia bacterium]
MTFRRYLCSRIDWNDRLICIKGPKGTGKTTLILQHIRETFGTGGNKAIYVALDHIWFATHDALEAIEYFHSHGFTHLFLDEVHHFPNWASLIKTISDFYPDLFVVYSGSSLLKLSESRADLSRRQAVYSLKGLSFREFLSFEQGIEVPVLPLEDVLSDHRSLAEGIVSSVKILPLFAQYLASGYYPFYRSVSSQFKDRLAEVVNTVLDVDFPAVEDVTPSTIRKAKKMLVILAKSCPQQPNMSALYRELGTDRNLGLKILDALQRAELLLLLESGAAKLKRMSKPEKIFPGDTNLMHALVPAPDVGALRETFFANQLRAGGHDVLAPDKGDFLVDGKFLFEIGGSQKGFSQVKDIPDSYIASDGIELGFGNKIPLWLFGCLY